MLQLDPATLSARWQDMTVTLSQTEFTILAAIQAKPHATADDLLLVYRASAPGHKYFGYDSEGSGWVSPAIRGIRRKLPGLLQSQRGKGYWVTDEPTFVTPKTTLERFASRDAAIAACADLATIRPEYVWKPSTSNGSYICIGSRTIPNKDFGGTWVDTYRVLSVTQWREMQASPDHTTAEERQAIAFRAEHDARMAAFDAANPNFDPFIRNTDGSFANAGDGKERAIWPPLKTD